MKHIATFSLLILSSFYLSAQSYILDDLFGNHGILISDLGESADVATDAIITQEGEVIIGGCKGTPQYDFMLVRKKADGRIDTDFGNEGHASFDLGSAMDDGTANYLQSDGNILIAGLTGTNSGIVRFLADGSPDLSFGNNGKVIANLSGSSLINDMSVQEDGKIIVVGSVSTSSSQGAIGALVMRLLPDGTMDASFGENGILIFSKDNSFTEAKSLAINGNGKILVGINSSGYAGLAQLNQNGSFDTSFGEQGYFSYSDTNGAIQDLLVLAGGRIIMTVYFQGQFTSGLLQVLDNGSLDQNFGTNGKVIAEANGKRIVGSNTILSKKGEFIMGATSLTPDHANADVMLTRFSKNGVWLKEDIAGGIVLTEIEGQHSYCAKILQNDDGAIIAIGYVEDEQSGEKDIAHLQFVSTATSVGISELPSIEKTTLFPNPVISKTQLQYELEESTTISLHLYNLQGQLVQTFVEQESRNSGLNKEFLDLPSGLAKGIYLINLDTAEGQRKSIRLVKQGKN